MDKSRVIIQPIEQDKPMQQGEGAQGGSPSKEGSGNSPPAKGGLSKMLETTGKGFFNLISKSLELGDEPSGAQQVQNTPPAQALSAIPANAYQGQEPYLLYEETQKAVEDLHAALNAKGKALAANPTEMGKWYGQFQQSYCELHVYSKFLLQELRVKFHLLNSVERMLGTGYGQGLCTWTPLQISREESRVERSK